jgi:5'-nucleotidase
MRILLTNDDGIYSEGLISLYNELCEIAQVDVVAPDSERSSVGHGITLSRPIFYKEIFIDNKRIGYGTSGTPADCVKLAVHSLIPHKPDLVISGINLGPNDGCSVYYSGTVAGAREGALMGIPSMAFSLNTFVKPRFHWAVTQTIRIIQKMNFSEWPTHTFLNVNIPNVTDRQLKGITVTRQSEVPIHSQFIQRQGPASNDYVWMTGSSPKVRKDLQMDTSALAQNYITITPIQCDTTDHAFLKKMRHWTL